jgi:hypothetical protein
LTKRKKSDINKPLSGDNHATQKDQRQKWPFWIGTGGRFQSESLAVFVGMRTQRRGCIFYSINYIFASFS